MMSDQEAAMDESKPSSDPNAGAKEETHGVKPTSDAKNDVQSLEATPEAKDVTKTVESTPSDPSAEPNGCYKYLEDGRMVYTDPASKVEYILDAAGSNWVPRTEFDNTKYKFDGETYHYTDDSTGVKHKWDLKKQDWIQVDNTEKETAEMKSVDEESEESEEDDQTTEEQRKDRQFRKRKAIAGWGRQGTYHTDPDSGAQLYKDTTDGMIYEWDKNKNAWFPRIDEDFMANYQMNYGFTPDGKAEPTLPSETPDANTKLSEAEAKKLKKPEEKKKADWFEEDQLKSTKVYVTNLPNDMNEEKFIALMTKCGVLDVDIRTNKQKIKIYRDENGIPKGDALCTYVKVESVSLALTIIDGSTIHSDSGKPHVITVERAKFEMKGNAYDPTKKPKKLGKKELEKAQKRREKLLAWVPDEMQITRKKSDKVVVIENVFDPKDFDLNAALILECSAKLREHCTKFGSVTKVVIYDKHPKGICQVFFKLPEEADMAISMLEGRLYSKACGVMKAYTWDGKTKYKVTETEEEEKERLANWEKFLKAEEEAAATASASASTTASASAPAESKS